MRTGRQRARRRARNVRATPLPIIDKKKDAFRRLPKGFARLPHRRVRLRPRHARGSRRPRRRRGGRGDERRQLQHHGGASRARDLRGRARRGSHLRPAPRRDLPAARHPDRRHRGLDDRPGPASPASPATAVADWTDSSGTVGLVERNLPAVWAGKKLNGLGTSRPVHAVGGHPPRRGAGRRARISSARTATSCTSWPISSTLDALEHQLQHGPDSLTGCAPRFAAPRVPS